MIRVPVLDKNGKPMMPTKASRARRWLEHLNVMRRRIPQFLRCGSFGELGRNSKNQTVYRGN